MSLIPGLGDAIPFIGGGEDNSEKSGDTQGAGGILGLLGGGSGGGFMPDPLGINKYLDMGFEALNDAGVDKIAGAIAGTYFLGQPGLGSKVGDMGGDLLANAFDTEEDSA
jgi:hypothetical protein